jgi:hypothetical protein
MQVNSFNIGLKINQKWGVQIHLLFQFIDRRDGPYVSLYIYTLLGPQCPPHLIPPALQTARTRDHAPCSPTQKRCLGGIIPARIPSKKRSLSAKH